MANTDDNDDVNRMPGTTAATERDLQRRVELLQKKLRAATQSLKRLRTEEKHGDDDGKETADIWTNEDANDWMQTDSVGNDGNGKGTKISCGGDRIATAGPPPPPRKRGYLFKWQDRSIGWGGTKWALRFVKLEHGNLSYYSSHNDTEAPRYVLSLRGCAVRDDGRKRNRRHHSASTKKGEDPPLEETGAYFFLFSIYQRPDREEDDQDSEVVPLLRFSTPALAEKVQWIQLISVSCMYCDTDAYLADELSRAVEIDRQERQLSSMARTMPESKPGTLPPVYFGSPHPTATAPVRAGGLVRNRSFTNRRLPGSKKFITAVSDVNAEKVESRSLKGYAPSRPMHRRAEPSYLSTEAPMQDYRGIFNLFFVILIVSNFRLILAAVRRHGFVLGEMIARMMRKRPGVGDSGVLPEHPWHDAPLIYGVLLQLAYVALCYGIEWMLSRRRIPEALGKLLHHVNAYSALLVPIWIVWNFIGEPVVGAALLLHASITWMKLLSYILANEDYRRRASVTSTTPSAASASHSSQLQQLQQQQHHHHSADLAMVENLDWHDANIVYPQNVSMGNLLYFWCAPTLTYQIAFPKYPAVRLWKVAGILVRMVAALVLFFFLATQTVTPTLDSLVQHLEETCGRFTLAVLADHWLRLSVVITYLWLIGFYVYFHLYLNLLAELLRFGDRVFYKDWWNSSDVSSYWRLWNTPVHYWLIRHLYFPCVRFGLSRTVATVAVFLLSAIMHEVLVSVPFHMIRPWSFLGMMMQIPLVAVTKYLYKRYPGSSVGNILFWISFCIVGQPMAILLYTVDYQYARQHQPLGDPELQECNAAPRGSSLRFL